MRTKKLTAKRALTLTIAGGLALGGTVALGGSSQAAGVTYKTNVSTTSPGDTTASPVLAQNVSLIGTDFTDDGGSPLFDTAVVSWSTTACAATEPASGLKVSPSVSVVSDTLIRITTPDATDIPLTASKPTKYNICLYKTGGSGANLLGSSSITVYTSPTVTAVTPATPQGPSYGGTKFTVTGQDFTSKSGVTIGGVPANNVKVTLGKTSSDDDVITGTTPASTATTAQAVKVTGEAGPVPASISGTAVTWAYKPAVTVSPVASDGTAGRLITVNGIGFNNLNFTTAPAIGTGTTASTEKSTIELLPPGLTTLLNGGGSYTPAGYFSSGSPALPTGAKSCSAITVISDTELTCTAPAVVGPYTVAVVTFSSSTSTVDLASTTGYSRLSTYTGAAF